MKKVIMLLVASAFATASFAQTAPTTEVKVRDNGTKKVVTKTGKTNVGAALENTADAAGNVAKKAGKDIKHGTQKLGAKLKKSTRKMEKKSAKNVSK